MWFHYFVFTNTFKKKQTWHELHYFYFQKIFKYLKKQTIILESSGFRGYRWNFCKKLKTKFSIGKNFYLGYSPERIDPGKDNKNKKLEYKKITKLVSYYSEACRKRITSLYKSIFSIYTCKSIEIAETAKIFENIFRSVNIAVVNEMKMITHKLNLNIHDVVEAAASKPFGFRKFVPGPELEDIVYQWTQSLCHG